MIPTSIEASTSLWRFNAEFVFMRVVWLLDHHDNVIKLAQERERESILSGELLMAAIMQRTHTGEMIREQ